MASRRGVPPALPPTAVAFEGDRLIALGDIADVARQAKLVVDGWNGGDRGPSGAVLVFDAETSVGVDLDLRGSLDDVAKVVASRMVPVAETNVLAPAESEAPRRPGRPRLGVIAREVTLLPRHWDWLSDQPGGASAALRRLVDGARRGEPKRGHRRQAQEAVHRFMSAMAGNEAGYEEALRALYTGNADRFATETEGWPPDIRTHTRTLARRAFDPEDD